MSQSLHSSWKEIENWLDAKAPKIKQALNPPALNSDFEELKNSLNISSLPEDLLNLYSIHNGLNSSELANMVYGIQFLSIDKILVEIENYDIFIKDKEINKLIHADKEIENNYKFSKSRIPIGSDSGTCLLCVDIKPTKEGSVGQIILLDHEKNVALNIAPSISEMYSRFVRDLHNNKYGLAEDALEDGVEWLDPTKELDIVNWHNIERWKHFC